ncbi:hypothetical protein [Gordonia crocea]|uniref:Uncharacterized protein n=1 Tax=Gordonia crocea TaxID=589162 RepID=A0A7I9UZG0_9ACTN|nr:hypothetical protein [Gordonia crocea]GED98210.1 hypothetical protein nbrc107697_22490 [Gordonia crocea]
MSGARLTQVICGVVAIVSGLAVIGLSAVPWLDLSELGMAVIKPSGIGWYYGGASRLTVSVGLGWATILFGLVAVLAGVLALTGRHLGAALVTGAGVATLVASAGAAVFRGSLVMNFHQLGVESQISSFVALTPALPLLIIAGTVMVGVGLAEALSDGSGRRPVPALAVAAAVGVVLAVVAIVVVWWSFSQPGVQVGG